MTRMCLLSAGVWTALALAAGSGCIPIYSPIVEVQPTTGEQLRAIELRQQGLLEDHHPRISNAELATLRARLLREPPSYTSVIDTYDRSEHPLTAYSSFNPGLYMPMDRERSDLQRAHRAGLLSDAELAELLDALEQQGQRSLVRRWFETCPYAAEGTVHSYALGGATYEPYRAHEPNSKGRMNGAMDWLHDYAAAREPARVGAGWWFPSSHWSRLVMTPETPPPAAPPGAPTSPAAPIPPVSPAPPGP